MSRCIDVPRYDILRDMPQKEALYKVEGVLLRQLRKQLNLTQKEMADKLGISLRQYQRYEAGEQDPAQSDFLRALSSVVGFSVEKLRNYFGGLPLVQSTTKWAHVPVFESVGAGIWQGSEEFPIEYIDVPIEVMKRKGVPPERVIGIRVVGNSMEPEIKDGDIILVADPSYVRPNSGDNVVVWLNGDGVVKVYKEINGGILLISTNPMYSGENKEIFIPKAKLKDTVIAKVIGLYRSY